jgi:hypothetical protein
MSNIAEIGGANDTRMEICRADLAIEAMNSHNNVITDTTFKDVFDVSVS